MNQIDNNWVAAHTKHRPTKGHKKTFGHVLVIAGSPGKVGSGILCARAVLHGGCGLVTAMIPVDGITALLAGNPDLLSLLNERHILTPHIGEFARIQTFSGNSEQQSFAFAHAHSTNLILKSSPTLVSLPSGQQFVNTTGNDGMATAGSGDVLTGITAALCAQGYENATAACLAVYVHGLAADIAVETQSKSSLVASDIIANLGKTRLLD